MMPVLTSAVRIASTRLIKLLPCVVVAKPAGEVVVVAVVPAAACAAAVGCTIGVTP